MKLVKKANGKQTIKMSHKEWMDMGKKAGWMKKEAVNETPKQVAENIFNKGHVTAYGVINEFESAANAYSLEDIPSHLRESYPNWGQNHFMECAKILSGMLSQPTRSRTPEAMIKEFVNFPEEQKSRIAEKIRSSYSPERDPEIKNMFPNWGMMEFMIFKELMSRAGI